MKKRIGSECLGGYTWTGAIHEKFSFEPRENVLGANGWAVIHGLEPYTKSSRLNQKVTNTLLV